MATDRITLGVQAGGIEADDVTESAYMPLRKQLAAHCTASYSPTIEEFAIILRISGSLDRFEGEGVQRLRINRKSAYVTADYVMPEERWNGVALTDIRKYLAAAAVEATRAMGQHLVKLKIAVDSSRLDEDVNQAVAAFLEGTPSSG